MTSHVFKMDKGLCYSGNELFQVKEQTEEQPRLGLVRWKLYFQSPPSMEPLSFQVFFEPSNIRESFPMWMDEKQIRACCPKLLDKFLEGKVSEPGYSGVEKDGEDKATEEEMKADVILLVERCDKVLERYKSPNLQGNSMAMLTNNVAILAAYAKVPELVQCLLDSGVVKLLADALLNSYREDEMHKNASEVLNALVSHGCVHDSKSTDIILQLITVISHTPADEYLCLFEGVSLTVVDLFASTVGHNRCPGLEQMAYCEVPGRIAFWLLQKYLSVLKMIETDGVTYSTGPLCKRFEFAMRFAELMDDIFMVMGWGPDLLKGGVSGCHGRQHNRTSIFTGLSDTHHPFPQPGKGSTSYKTRRDFSSEHEYGRYVKSVLKEDMWVKARCTVDDINVGHKGQFRYSNSRSPPARVEWEGYGYHWVHWHVLEIVEENNGIGKSIQLEQSPIASSVQRKHLYGLNVVGSHGDGDVVERADWWELLFYLNKLDPSQLDSILTMLASYNVKSVDDMVQLLPSVQEAKQIISHLRKHHPLLLEEPLSLGDSSAAQARPHNDCSSTDQVTIKPHPPMEDPCPANDETAPTTWSVVRSLQHEPSHLGQGYSSSYVEVSFGPEDNNSSSGQEEEELSVSGNTNTAGDTTNSTTGDTTSNTTGDTTGNPTSNTTSNTTGNTTSNTTSKTTGNTVGNSNNSVDSAAGLRRSSRIAVKPRKSFADIVAGKANYTAVVSQAKKKKKKKKKTRKELDYNVLEVKLNLASVQLIHNYSRFCAKVDEVLKVVTGDRPHGYRILARCLTLMQNGLRQRHGRLLVEDALSGGFKTILHAIQLGAKSARVQQLGITCFFYQMGRCSYGYLVTNVPCDLHSREERNSIMAIVHSLVSNSEHGGLRTLVKGLYCTANQYNKEMSDTEKRSSVEAVTNGLVILANVLHADGSLIGKMADWELPKCLEIIRSEFPIFPGKGQLIGMMDRFPINSSTPSSDEKYCQEMKSLIQQLDGDSCQTAIFQLLGRISNRIIVDNSVTLVEPPEIFIRSILHYNGIVKLVNLLERPNNISSSVCSDIVLIIGCVAYAGSDQCSKVILQGGVRGLVTVLNQTTHPRRLQLLAIKILNVMAEDGGEDNRAAMRTKSLDNCVSTLLERYEKDQEVMPQLEMLKGNAITLADDMSANTRKLLVGVLSGTMQLIVRHINDCRRQQTPVILPRLGNFVQYMSSVLSGSAGVQEQCWERIEVSSGNYHKDHLTDGNKLTYWESSGRSGSHWIRVYMKKDVTIRSLAIGVDSGDSSYTPQKVMVEGGSNLAQMSVLSNTTVEPNTSGSVTLLSDVRKHYPIINIKIRQCYQGGIDTRIHSLTLVGSQFNPLWSVFGEVLSASTGIFYHMLTHTWSQEATQSNLLDLFDRLSDRVAYEQKLADTYFHSAVARDSLGQTCHQYLIQPIAKTFANNGGDKQLTNLIGQYLQHLLCPSLKSIIPVVNGNYESSCDQQVDADDWIVMSRVRCMCRLLVDCNSFTSAAAITSTSSAATSPSNNTTTNNPRNKGLKKVSSNASLVPSVSKSSSDALVQCWKSIVKKQLQEALGLLLTDDKPHGVATGLINIYTKLKCAMRELFGGHSRYAISLKEGFAEELQTLSESHSVQFCQSFCSSIDSLLNVIGPDHQQLSTTMETEREAILTQLAEPLQFIHNLDLSHVFEHYYRYYLSTRILHGWTLSLSLERRLVQLFAHCFPRKYPMLMLADLDQSKQLMDKFCDSELLESLDMLLTTSRLHKPHEYSISVPGVTELAQKCSFYKRHTLQVYTLTPCHWSLGCQPLLPLQALPHPLQQFCSDYQSFYTSATHDAHSHNRKLEWTVHGYGCLNYNNLQLMVSTAQMIVLLQYNRSEAHQFRSLQSNTQLGEELLSHTLLSLTSQPQNILVTSSHNHPFPPNTLFTLNHKFLSDVGKRHRSHCIWLHDARLTSGDHGNNKQVDLAHLFERRRNIIDAAIVRILKRDREVSMDTIASIVIKGCSAGQFEGGIPFEQFDCANRDVCFRIDRLVTDGYLHRCDEHPQMILYQPSTMELSSNSQPVSHDHRRASPICRKRSLAMGEKMIASAVARSKRRPTEMFSHTHLVTKTMASSSLTFEQVKSLIITMVTRISEVIKLPNDQVEWLLRRHQWSEDAVIQKYLSHGDDILTEAGLSNRTISPSLSQKSSTCKICLNEVTDIASLPCEHTVCKTCCKQYLLTRLKQNVSLDTTCPTPSCKQPVTRMTFHQLLNADTFGQYELAVVKSYVEMSKWFTWCRNPQGCGMALRKGDGSKSGTCSKCQWSSCFSCTFTEAHEPASCKEMTQWMEAGGFYEGMGEDAKSKQLSKMIAKLCPGCSAPIEKNEGCLHMKCKCGCDFCWKCLKPWKPSHSDYYSCSAKASKAAQDVRKFVDFNQRCSQHHTSHGFARRLCQIVKSVNEPVNMNHLTFIIDACELLSRCHKLLAYACVSDFFRSKNTTDVFTFLTEHLEGDTNALQAFLENTLLSSSNVARAIRRLTERQLNDGYQLVNKINSTREKLLVGADQLRFGVVANEPTSEVVIPSTNTGASSATSNPFSALWDHEHYSDEDNMEYDDDIYSSSDRYGDSPYCIAGSPSYYDSDCYYD